MSHNREKNIFFLLVVLVIVTSLIIPVGVEAATGTIAQPYASYYLDNYSAYVYLPGGGEVQVYFDVQGTRTMDELGALSIKIYESTDKETWTRVVTYTHDSTSGMLGYDDFFYSSHVTYQGVEGRYYKAYVCIWAGKDGDGDTRYFWTTAKP
ncbi:MAG: hypothetical protein Q4D50_07680 [Eubacteriales bacterium]|nr:hypothetical protein [Eubacteriales bacterium]